MGLMRLRVIPDAHMETGVTENRTSLRWRVGERRVVVKVYEDNVSLSDAAAGHAATSLRKAIQDRGLARIVVATGASQIDFLKALTAAPDIDWKRVELFHLDEYVGLPVTHPASFRKYLLERLICKVGIGKYHLLDGTENPDEMARLAGERLRSGPIDIAFAGIGENGHLAFNDPPADFETEEPYIVVELDEACRQQQVGEGWFADISEVPTRAITMSVRQILKANEVLSVVPDARKARAVKLCFEGKITPLAPASVLLTHPAVTVYLDKESASLLSALTLAALAVTA
jgi:glucosamine-6-phosphate deaminase